MKKFCLLFIAIIPVTFFSCKEAYRPHLKSTTNSYLVVEGVMNAGPGPTTISLTHTSSLDTVLIRPEANALVTVEGKDNTTRQLAYTGGSNYYSPDLHLITGNEYRLRIRTTNGKEYLSAYVKARITPAIDSVGWQRNQEGVSMYANTHDASGDTRYYRWDFNETWEIKSYYYSSFIYVSGANIVRPRTAAENVYTCWKYGSNKSILLASSERLQSDVIFKAPVNFINENDEKLCVRYSILLHQYALDKEGYKFYELMKRNTENLGSVFDAQPTEIKGNITCVTDPSEIVIGYVSASTIEEKRIFISNSELPGWRMDQNCQEDTVANTPDNIRLFFAGGGIVPYSSLIANGFIVAYLSSSPTCVDCTSRQGSTTRPSYW
jgi:Domain of unknown function (DUF4249)